LEFVDPTLEAVALDLPEALSPISPPAGRLGRRPGTVESPLDKTFEGLLAQREAVAGLARRLSGRDAHAAEDLEQEVWAAALAHPPRQSSSLRGWLRTITRTRSVERLRRRGRAGRAEREAARPEAIEGADESVARRDQALRLARALQELDEPYRAVLILRFVEDLAPREVAQRLDRPVETVRTQTRRGLLLLRRKLEARPAPRSQRALALLGLLRAPRRAAAALIALAGAAAVVVVALDTTRGSLAAVLPAGAPAAELAAAPSDGVATQARRTPAEHARPEPVDAARAPARRWIDVEATDADGRPLAAVAVSVVGPAGERPAGRTDGRGRLRVPLDLSDLASAHAGWMLEQDAAELALRADGLADVHAFVFLPDSGATRLDVALAQPGRRLQGRVLDDLGRPLSGAQVQVAPASGTGGRRRLGEADDCLAVVRAQTTHSDAEGRFALDGLPREPLHVFASADGHALGRLEVGTQGEAVELALVPSSPLRGSVRLGGRPAEGALVTWEVGGGPDWPSAWCSALTDECGRFELPRPPDGEIELSARAQGDRDRTVLELSAHPAPWDAELVAGTLWSVRLLEADGRPAAGMYLNLRCARSGRLWGAAECDAQGRAGFAGTEAGPADLVVLPPRGAGIWPREVVRGLDAGDGGEIVVRLEPRTQAPAAVSARFVDGASASLLLSHVEGGVEQSMAPDARGELAWNDLPSGRWRARARVAGGREIDLGEFELEAGVTRDLGRIE
jgi:RNA polymerase sigma-70 factor (ECF subfamily)